MKASRPTKIIRNVDDVPANSWLGILRRQANNILTLLLVIAAIAMLIRWRMKTAEAARQSINNELSSAQTQVGEIRGAMFEGRASGPALLKFLNEKQNAAIASISDVLNSSDADARMRAGALIARGDLYWDLANLPDLPGSSTQPSLQLADKSSTLLEKASDAYEEVIKNSTYADQHEALAAAHLGLAAIAENKLRWDAARQEFEAVIHDGKTLKVLADRAQAQLDMIATLQQDRFYVAPPEGTGNSAMDDMIKEMIRRAATQASTQPTTGPSTMPTTMPTTLPMTNLVPATRATTQPVK